MAVNVTGGSSDADTISAESYSIVRQLSGQKEALAAGLAIRMTSGT
jgi:hypothetical protein